MCSWSPPPVYSAMRASESSSPISPTVVVPGYSSSSARSALQEHQVLGPALVVEVVLPCVGLGGVDGRVVGASVRAGLSRSSASWKQKLTTSSRKPSTPAVQPEAQRRRAAASCTAGLWKFEVGLAGQEVVQVVLARGARPTARRCRRTPTASCSAACRRRLRIGPDDTSRPCGLSRLARLSTNQACWSEQWLSTWSIMTFRPQPVRRARPARRSRPACRRSDRRRGSRRCRSRSPSSGS